MRLTLLLSLSAFAAAAAASTVVGPAVGPTILGAADKAGAKLAVVGSGDHQYECHHGWGTLPDHLKWETTHGIAVDGEGLIYIKYQGSGAIKEHKDTIVVCDADGKFVRSFG